MITYLDTKINILGEKIIDTQLKIFVLPYKYITKYLNIQGFINNLIKFVQYIKIIDLVISYLT